MAKKTTSKTSTPKTKTGTGTSKSPSPSQPEGKGIGAPIGVGTATVVSADSLEFPKRTRASIYDGLMEQVEQLKPGQAAVLPVPEGDEPATIMNRVTAAMRRCEPTPPEGCEFRKRVTTDGKQIAIIAHKLEAEAAE